ncbi:hypothetical protein CFP56_030905 [Quercus suber]|uniref:DUF2921 domain-containing protein n=1 Tax=Quercus suber TaxID=58331 RepID=A0AAW0JKU4_QUESU
MGSNSCSSSSKPRKLKFTLSPFLRLLFLFLNVPTTTTAAAAAFFRNPFRKPEILYSEHCNDDFLRFEFAFFSGGIGIFNSTAESGISLSFDPSYIHTTTSHGVHKFKATLYIRDPLQILADASVGDCSIGFSLRFPAVFSLRNVGEIWSKKDVNDSDCFGRIGFQSWERPSDPQGLRYEYTEIEEVRNSCALGEETIRGKGKSYPDG